MRTLAIINQKGGCGKTTTSINLAATLAAGGHRTLLVDMDPQGHCGLGLSVPESQVVRDVSDVLRGEAVAVGDAVWRVARRLDLVPASVRLAGVEQELAGRNDRDRRLAIALSGVEHRYDFCIVDCPPSIGLLTFNALRAAGEVIVPVETGYFALQGSLRQLETVEMLARRVGHRVRFSVLPTMVDVRTRLSREILSQLHEQFGERLLPMTIGYNGKLKEAAGYGQPITEYDAASRACADFGELAAWLVANPPQEEAEAELEDAVEERGAEVWPGDLGGAGRWGTAGTGGTGGAGAEAQVASVGVETRGLQPSPAASSSSSPMPVEPRAGVSRAAELVERARALSARAAELAAKVNPPEAKRPVPGGAARGARGVTAVGGVEAQATPEAGGKGECEFGVEITPRGVVFRQPREAGRELAVAGEFSDWQPVAMERDAERGGWRACLTIPPGRWRYRLVTDGRWSPDPYNGRSETNEFGESNSLVDVSAEDSSRDV